MKKLLLFFFLYQSIYASPQIEEYCSSHNDAEKQKIAT